MRKNGGVTVSAGREREASGSLWSFGRRSARTAFQVQGLDPADASEIEAMLNAVSTAGDFPLRLLRRLNPLVQRCVPPRAIEAAPVPRAARLRFADGTSVVVKSAVPGDVGVLALAMRHGSVKPAACTTGPDGCTRLVFTWPGRHKELSLRVVGLDQPD
jgi:hypothetical protein